MKEARCKTCQKKYKVTRGNTTTLWRHARDSHKKELQDAQEEGKAKGTQPTLKQILEKRTERYDQGSERKKLLDMTVARMIAQDLQPLSVVEDQGFITLCRALDKKFQLPCRRTLRNVLIPKLFKKVQEEVKAKLSGVTSVCITTDLWTSNSNASFMAATSHYWNPKSGGLESTVLDCHRIKGSHTADLISQELGKVLQGYNIREKVLTSVTDNGSNIMKAVQDMGIRRISCYAHLLNLVVMEAIKSTPSLQQVREQVSKVVTMTKTSTVAKEKLDQIQESLGMKPKKLLQDVVTRWNSLFLMLERFLKLKNAVTLFLSDAGMDKDIGHFGSCQWEVIEEAVQLLRPCYEATVELSAEKFATGSKVIPITKMLMGWYATADREADFGSLKKELASKILSSLNKRFNMLEDVRILCMATLLDPRFKNRCFRSSEKKKNALSLLNKELRDTYEMEQLKESTSEPASKRDRCKRGMVFPSLWYWQILNEVLNFIFS